jgi:hypothetical protein
MAVGHQRMTSVRSVTPHAFADERGHREEARPAPARVQVGYGRPGPVDVVDEPEVLPGRREPRLGLDHRGQRVQRHHGGQQGDQQQGPVLAAQPEQRGEHRDQQTGADQRGRRQHGDQAEPAHPVEIALAESGRGHPVQDQRGRQQTAEHDPEPGRPQRSHQDNGGADGPDFGRIPRLPLSFETARPPVSRASSRRALFAYALRLVAGPALRRLEGGVHLDLGRAEGGLGAGFPFLDGQAHLHARRAVGGAP